MVNFSLQWHITQKCGNNCRHCYMDQSEYDLTFDDYLVCINNIALFEKKEDFIVKHIVLTGGDPLLNQNWFDIAKDIKLRGKRLSFLGNPETLTETNLDKISSLSLQMFQLSLDGMRETHDKLRYEGSFDKTIDGIKKLNDHGIPVGIMFTLSNENEDNLIDLIEFLDSLKIKMSFAFDFVIETGNAYINQITGKVNKLGVFDKYIELKNQLYAKGTDLVLQEKPSQLFAYKNMGIINDSINEKIPFSVCSGCGAGWKHLTIVKKGDVLACRRMPIIVGNLFKDSFEDILLNSPHLKELRSLETLGECSSCLFRKFCRGCPADNYATTGTLFKSEKGCTWYKPIAESQLLIRKEWEKLKDQLFLESILENDKKDFIKANIILCKKNERDHFLVDSADWLNKHNLDLTQEEIGTLLFLSIR